MVAWTGDEDGREWRKREKHGRGESRWAWDMER